VRIETNQPSDRPTGGPPVRASARLDVWLWSVRLAPTRAVATELCRAGRVQVNGGVGKASTAVKLGDRIEARLGQRLRIVEVAQVIDKRVGAALAVECFADHSPVDVRESSPPVFQRERGAGRPTKRDRRQIDRLRGG
jgi:ribosome-associated heat shock protein Hsp15